MNWPKKSADCSRRADGASASAEAALSVAQRSGDGAALGENLACLHLLAVLFPALREEPFLLQQLKSSMDAVLVDSCAGDLSFDAFARLAAELGRGNELQLPFAFAYFRIDFSGRGWDPLFARSEIISALKTRAGAAELLCLIHGLWPAICPQRSYRTQARVQDYERAKNSIEDWVREWTLPSTVVHLLYL